MTIENEPRGFSKFLDNQKRHARYFTLVDRYFSKKEAQRNYRLAEKSASHEFHFKVLDSGWATQRCLTDDKCIKLTHELIEIDRKVGNFVFGFPQSLHWSRRYEYPYAITNSLLLGQETTGLKILECGSYITCLQYYFAQKGCESYSLDLNLHALRHVSKIRSQMRLENLHLSYGNILDLPFSDKFFDRVLCISVLEHMVSDSKKTDVVLRGALNELLRVLKQDGRLVLAFDVNMKSRADELKLPSGLSYSEYKLLFDILHIPPLPPPSDRLCSSDTDDGRRMGEDLCVYCATLARC